jgi:hypothetical protein
VIRSETSSWLDRLQVDRRFLDLRKLWNHT